MMSRAVLFLALVSLAAIAQGHSLQAIINPNVTPLQREGRLVEVPTFGDLILKGAKSIVFLLKSAWSLVGLKLGAIVLIAHLIISGFKHGVSIVIGSFCLFGFCKLSGKCNVESIPKPVIDIGRDTLIYAAKQLQNGVNLYENEI